MPPSPQRIYRRPLARRINLPLHARKVRHGDHVDHVHNGHRHAENGDRNDEH
jgi:hypothetical protein